MNSNDLYIIKGKFILSLSAIFIVLSISFYAFKNINFSKEEYNLAYETIDIQTMAVTKVAVKKGKSADLLSIINPEKSTTSTLKAVSLLNKNDSQQNYDSPKVSKLNNVTPSWRLPTEQGYITQYAHYNHIALDITSARGSNETIYPVANGTITSITHDNAGAKIVTVNHYIDGKYYTSQYVHLAWFAPGIYVGQQVTTDTPLGAMGTTGISTGIHLHIAVFDCNLYDPNDPYCSTLNGFYNYGKTRISQGFYGLGNLINVPYSWTSR